MSTSPSSAPVLTVDEVSISFTVGFGRETQVKQVVHDVSFELQRGRVLALVGESGSGKSVTAMSILGLLPGTAKATGSIKLGDQELLGADNQTLRQVRGGKIGTIFQEPSSALNPVFTIGRQLTEGLRQHHPKLGRHEANEIVLRLLESVDVPDPRRIARSFPHEVSGGQLQRAMIAMAISNEPLALIADEPTTALDVTVQAGILNLIRDLKDRLGTAVLLITHDMGVVADLADDVVVLKDGVVVEAADVATLFSAPQHEYTRTLLSAVPRLASLRLNERTAPDQGQHVAVESPAAELRDASVIYRGRGLSGGLTAVDAATLVIGRGEVVGLVGESGSGKSTIGRALSGLVPIASGNVRLDGLDLARANKSVIRQARARLGIVFQDPASSLNPRHTIGRSIAEPIVVQRGEALGSLNQRTAELLDAVQLGAHLAGRFPHELSGGQRQRVAIARAISMNPSLLIADEPTSALDVSVQARILELLRSLQRDLNFACLFISHDLAVVGQVTDRVAVMHHGKIVEQGETSQVLASPIDPYTQRLLAAAPVADPEEQRSRREAWLALAG